MTLVSNKLSVSILVGHLQWWVKLKQSSVFLGCIRCTHFPIMRLRQWKPSKDCTRSSPQSGKHCPPPDSHRHRVDVVCYLLVCVALPRWLPFEYPPSVQLRCRQLSVNRAVGAVNLFETQRFPKLSLLRIVYRIVCSVRFNISCTRKV